MIVRLEVEFCLFADHVTPPGCTLLLLLFSSCIILIFWESQSHTNIMLVAGIVTTVLCEHKVCDLTATHLTAYSMIKKTK